MAVWAVRQAVGNTRPRPWARGGTFRGGTRAVRPAANATRRPAPPRQSGKESGNAAASPNTPHREGGQRKGPSPATGRNHGLPRNQASGAQRAWARPPPYHRPVPAGPENQAQDRATEAGPVDSLQSNAAAILRQGTDFRCHLPNAPCRRVPRLAGTVVSANKLVVSIMPAHPSRRGRPRAGGGAAFDGIPLGVAVRGRAPSSCAATLRAQSYQNPGVCCRGWRPPSTIDMDPTFVSRCLARATVLPTGGPCTGLADGVLMREHDAMAVSLVAAAGSGRGRLV